MPNCEKDLIDIVSSLATPTLACIALVFAALQWFTNKRRLCHELFDRRYPQYIAIKSFLSGLGANGAMLQDSEREFSDSIAGIRFIFSEEIENFVNKEVYELGVKINLYNELIKDPVEIEKGAAKKRGELVNKSREVSNLVDSKFSIFLQLKQ